MAPKKSRGRVWNFLGWTVLVVLLIGIVVGSASVAAQGVPAAPWARPGLPPAKATALANAVLATPLPFPTAATPLPTPEPLHFPPGIQTPNSEGGHVWDTSLVEKNRWVGIVGTTSYLVVAGYRPDQPMVAIEPRHPVVRVMTLDPATGDQSDVGQYDVPLGTGVDVTIVGVDGATLHLQSSRGGTIDFDVQTHQFLSTTAVAGAG
jgi:hypothetical protein